jgi:hypothetical protein
MPQPKKHPSARARVNRASTASTLSEEVTVVRPELPGSREWHPQTVEWWGDLWSAPMAAEYHSSDRHALFILAALVDDFWLEPSPKKAGEIRLQRQAFGLTPYDRRRLEWTIESAEESKARGRQRTQREQPPSSAPDPRNSLYAV